MQNQKHTDQKNYSSIKNTGNREMLHIYSRLWWSSRPLEGAHLLAGPFLWDKYLLIHPQALNQTWLGCSRTYILFCIISVQHFFSCIYILCVFFCTFCVFSAFVGLCRAVSSTSAWIGVKWWIWLCNAAIKCALGGHESVYQLGDKWLMLETS